MRFRLLQARIPADPVRAEELSSFAELMNVPEHTIVPMDVLHDDVSFATATEGVDAVLVGGSGDFSVCDDVPWMHGFLDTLGALATEGFPTFASCFGFQGLVVALGGDVIHDGDNAEVGTYELHRSASTSDDPLFGNMPTTFRAQLGHKDRARVLPQCMTNFASSERCPYQAIRVGDAPVYATQFHPELTHDANLFRFLRYKEQYIQVFGVDQFEALCENFRPSPESNALLAKFADLVGAA